MLCFYFWNIESHYWYFFIILYNLYIIQLKMYSMGWLLLLFPVLYIYFFSFFSNSHTYNLYIYYGKKQIWDKIFFFFPCQTHLPFAICCSSWSSFCPFLMLLYSGLSQRALYTTGIKECTIQKTVSPFREKLYFHPSLPLPLLLLWYFWRLEILTVWLVKCHFSSNSCVYDI